MTPANPITEKAWTKRGRTLGEAAQIIAENEDVKIILHDPEALPASIALLAMIYDETNETAIDAVKHWLRRPHQPYSCATSTISD